MKSCFIVTFTFCLIFRNFALSETFAEVEARFSNVRAKDKQLDSCIRLLDLQPMHNIAKRFQSNRGFRLISCSSWGVDVISIFYIGNSEIRFDGIKAQSGYILFLDRAKWGDAANVFSNCRTVRILDEKEIVGFSNIASPSNIKNLAKAFRVDTEASDVDGGILVFEWLLNRDAHIFTCRPTVVQTSHSDKIGLLVKFFYDLAEEKFKKTLEKAEPKAGEK